MANGSSFDVTDAIAGLDRLSNDVREKLARTMAYRGGEVIQKEARLRVPSKFAGEYNPKSRGSHAAGKLRDSIYVARNKRSTTSTSFVYSVSWNSTDGSPNNAFWGRFIEFGWYMRYAWFVDKNGMYHTIKSRELAEPIRVPATPFLGPAYDAKLQDVRRVMIQTGRDELPKLLSMAT
jgi:HK97 gp10 family phage protein